MIFYFFIPKASLNILSNSILRKNLRNAFISLHTTNHDDLELNCLFVDKHGNRGNRLQLTNDNCRNCKNASELTAPAGAES